MPRLPVTVILLLFAPLALAQIYTWTDATGTVHFSEAPPAAGTQFREMKMSGTAVAPRAAPAATREPGAAPEPAAPAPAASAAPMEDTPANRVKLCATLSQNLATLSKTAAPGAEGAAPANANGAELATTQAQYAQYCQ